MMIVAQDISVRRGARRVIDRVDLRIDAGELVALVGPNGAGKSTLFDTLAGVIDPAEGHIAIAGRPLRAWSPQALAKVRAVLPQRAAMPFPLSVLEVVLLGRIPHAARPSAADLCFAEHALARLDLLHLAERPYPALSGGEQQRVQIARTLVQIARPDDDASPRALMLDEPCASLDLAHARLLYRVLADEARSGVAVLVVDHDLARAATADRLVVIAQGRVLADGPPADALDPGLVTRAWGVACELVRLPSGALALDIPPGAQP